MHMHAYNLRISLCMLYVHVCTYAQGHRKHLKSGKAVKNNFPLTLFPITHTNKYRLLYDDQVMTFFLPNVHFED